MVISELGLLSEIWAWSGTYQLAISGGRAALSPPTNTQRNPHSTMTTLPSLYSCDTFLFIFPYNFLCLLFSPAIPPSSPPPPPFPPFLSLFTPSSTSPSTSSSTEREGGKGGGMAGEETKKVVREDEKERVTRLERW